MSSSGQPRRTIAAPEPYLSKVLEIEKRWFDLWDNGAEWSTHEDELEPIDKEWWALKKEYGIT